MRPLWRVALVGLLPSVLIAGCTTHHSGRNDAQPTHQSTGKPTQPSASPSITPGGEAVTVGQCTITDARAVSASFGGRVQSAVASTSGTGNPICRFILSGSNAGKPGVIVISLNESATEASYQVARRAAPHPVSVAGVCDGAFYAASTATLRFRSGHNVGAIQGTLHRPGGSLAPSSTVRADAAKLAKAICAEL